MPSNKQNQLTKTLLQFYDKPVAQVSLELFFTVVAVIIFALFAIRPTLSTMAKLIKELEDKTALNQRLAEKAASLSTAQVQYESLKPRLAILDKAIPPTPKFEEAILILEKIASENQLSILSLSAKEVPKESSDNVSFDKKTRVARPVVLVVTGDYASIRQLVENIQNTQRALIIESVVFRIFEHRGKKSLQATLTINVPYFAVDQAAAATSGPKATPKP